MLLFIAKIKRKLSARQFLFLHGRHDLSKKHCAKLLIKTGASIDGSIVIRPPFFFERGNFKVGKGVFINSGCVFLDKSLITIGDYVMFGPHVRLCTTAHDTHPDRRRTNDTNAPISIGSNVWLGAGAVVLPGVTVGENSVIAANSVVTESVPPNALYAGSPARFKRWLIEPLSS